MKKNLRFTFLLLAIAIFQFANAQLTKLSNNTSLTGLLINNKPILGSDVDNTLWTTDGTSVGTKQYTAKVITDSLGNGGAGLLGGKLYFAGMESVHGSELWVTDGTDAGTALIKDIEPGTASSIPTNFFAFNNQLFFFDSTAAAGYELWKTDGTTAGTVMVKDINPGTASSSDGIFNYFANNGILYFEANDGVHGTELWKTDGTNAGTVMVKDINPGAGDGVGGYIGLFGEAISLGNITLFSADDGTGPELWKTDGTTAGTVLVKDINSDPSGSRPNSFVAFNNKIYFSATSMNEGEELWVTDGTTGGTNLVKDIYTGVQSSAPELISSVIFGNLLVFTATDPTYGTELWSTDGTAAGTALLKDVNPGAESSDPSVLFNFNLTNLSFVIDHKPPFNGKVFFNATNATGGSELWITDGTTAGTVLVKGINAGSSFISSYFYTQNVLFFDGDDGTTGSELWKSDGTSAGTGLIQDINPGANSSDPTFNFVYNNQLYITADDGDNAGNLTDLFVLNQNVSLPVTLFNFAATVQTSRAVKLEWNTTNELNSSHFDIQRSADGINFSKIDNVNAVGNSGLNQRYQYIDQQPVHLVDPVLFYRLKMIDKDASFEYSKVLAVHFTEGTLAFSFSPNPVQNQLSVFVAAAGSKVVALRVTDASGKQVYQQMLSSSASVLQQNINVAGWQKGMYFIQLITDNSTKTAKFVKQ